MAYLVFAKGEVAVDHANGESEVAYTNQWIGPGDRIQCTGNGMYVVCNRHLDPAGADGNLTTDALIDFFGSPNGQQILLTSAGVLFIGAGLGSLYLAGSMIAEAGLLGQTALAGSAMTVTGSGFNLAYGMAVDAAYMDASEAVLANALAHASLGVVATGTGDALVTTVPATASESLPDDPAISAGWLYDGYQWFQPDAQISFVYSGGSQQQILNDALFYGSLFDIHT